MHTFFPSKSFGQKLDISPQNVIFSKPFGSEFLYIYIYIKVWFIDQTSKPNEIEDNINISLVVKQSIT